MSFKPLVATIVLLTSGFATAQKSKPIHIRIDLTDASRHLLHVTERIPVHPGANSFPIRNGY